MTKAGIAEAKQIIKRKIDETIAQITTKWGSKGGITNKIIKAIETTAKNDTKVKTFLKEHAKREQQTKKEAQKIKQYLNKKYKTSFDFSVYVSTTYPKITYNQERVIQDELIEKLKDLKDVTLLKLTENPEEITQLVEKLKESINKITK